MKNYIVILRFNQEWWARVKELARRWLPIRVEVKEEKQQRRGS